jgi:PAS domain S-box-containing protein
MSPGESTRGRGGLGRLRPGALIIGYFVILVVIAASTLPTLVGTLQTLDRQQATFDVASAGASELLVSALNQETGSRGYILTGDPSFLQPYQLGETQSVQATEDLHAVSLDPPFNGQVTATLRALRAWRGLITEAITDVRQHNLADARAVSLQTSAKSRFDSFRHDQEVLSTTVRNDLRDGRQALHNQVIRSILVLSIATAVGIIIGLLLWLWWRLWGRHSAERERELAQRALLMQSAIDATSDSLYAKDLEGRHILANRARAIALTGGNPEADLIGHTVDEFVAPDVANDIHQNEDLVVRTGRERQFQEVLAFPDGPHVFSMTKSPMRSSDGEIVGIIGISRDVTVEMALLEDRDRLYRLEHRLSEALQESLLGNDAVDDPRLEVCARYLPAANELAVGGDWYDVLPKADGRIALVVGDAVGHGIESVTAMGQLRSALAALVNLPSDPAAILEVLDPFAATLTRGRSATCLLVFVDPEREQVTYSCAGHMPPIFVYPGRSPEVWAQHQDPPLAVTRSSRRRNTVVSFPVGSTLVLYTDGLIERRNELIDVGLRRLVDMIDHMAYPPMDELCDRVIKTLVAPDDQDDDVAILAARLIGNRLPTLSPQGIA